MASVRIEKSLEIKVKVFNEQSFNPGLEIEARAGVDRKLSCQSKRQKVLSLFQLVSAAIRFHITLFWFQFLSRKLFIGFDENKSKSKIKRQL